jgi:hypothetical protein
LRQLFVVFRRCPAHVQARLHGHPEGWSKELAVDPQARIKIVSLFRKWAESDEVRNHWGSGFRFWGGG